MKVFISWSGPRSRHLADALRVWLPRVIQSVKPWMSDEDIAAGARWLPEISAGLADARVGILCVTPENQSNPWLVFEAGALSKTVEQTFVCPVLFDMAPSQLHGPLAQFQAAAFDKQGVFRVLQNLNTVLQAERLPDADLEEIFEVWWPKLNDRLGAAPALDQPITKPRTTDDLLEEILSLSREQLRRETLRIEHMQARDERLTEAFPMFERMASAASTIQEAAAAKVANGDRIPAALNELIAGIDQAGIMAQMLSVMRSQSEASKLELAQLAVLPSDIGN